MKTRKLFQKIGLLGLSIIIISCSNDKVEEASLTVTQQSFIDEYIFSTYNLSPTSFGNTLSTKWQNEVKLYVQGEITDDYREMIQDYLEDLNLLLTDGTKFSLVRNLDESNVHLILGSPFSIELLWPDIFDVVIDSNFQGYALYDWDANNYMTKGRIWVRNSSKNLFIHELGHVLGMGHSSSQYCGDGNISIMCSSAKATRLNWLDLEIIKALYNSDTMVGLTQTEMRILIEEYVKNNSILQ